ncbi:MAG: RnfH family protein [Pseudomonadota bacterium]
MSDTEMIEVEVAYALPDKQKIYTLLVEKGTTVLEAAKRSAIATDFPGVDLDTVKMGIFGQAVKAPASQALERGDRVEVYRPLIADPKEARRKRAAKAAASSKTD